MTSKQRTQLTNMERSLESFCQAEEFTNWERHALKAAYFAVSAVCFQEPSSIAFAERESNKAAITLTEAAQILYGYTPKVSH